MSRTQKWSSDLHSMNLVLKALRDQSTDVPTQEALAKKTGFTQSKVAAIESGRPVQVDDLETWAQGLGVNPDVLKRFHRTLEGYLWTAEAGEFWWRDYLASEYEQKILMTEPPTCLDDEQLRSYSEDQAEEWDEYVRERYRKYVLTVAKELFSHTNSELSIEVIHSTEIFDTGQFEMCVELAPTTQRPKTKKIRVSVEPPIQTPRELLNWMIQNDVKKEFIAKQLGEVLTATEFKKVVAYVQGLLDSRTLP